MLWKLKMLLKKAVIALSGAFPGLLSDEAYSNILYFIIFGKSPNLKAPKTFNEHIVAAKLEDRKYGYAPYTDKYEVRQFVKSQIGEQYLNPMLGIYDSFDEIDLEALPQAFVLKATHASGFNIIVPDKDKLDIPAARKKFDRWLATNFYYKDREKNYKNIIPRILCDQYIQFDEMLVEYKLYCFFGKVRLICQNIDKDGKRYTNVLNEHFEPLDVRFGYDRLPYPLTDKKEELIAVAQKLSAPFAFVRVDLYENGGQIRFSELTFHSGGGLVPFQPASYDVEFGKFFEQV